MDREKVTTDVMRRYWPSDGVPVQIPGTCLVDSETIYSESYGMTGINKKHFLNATTAGLQKISIIRTVWLQHGDV